MIGRKPIFIHYVHDMERARRFYESVFGVTLVRILRLDHAELRLI